jgi:hypothetical protein
VLLPVLLLPDMYKGVVQNDALWCFSLRACGGKIDLCQYIEQNIQKPQLAFFLTMDYNFLQ